MLSPRTVLAVPLAIVLAFAGTAGAALKDDCEKVLSKAQRSMKLNPPAAALKKLKEAEWGANECLKDLRANKSAQAGKVLYSTNLAWNAALKLGAEDEDAMSASDKARKNGQAPAPAAGPAPVTHAAAAAALEYCTQLKASVEVAARPLANNPKKREEFEPIRKGTLNRVELCIMAAKQLHPLTQGYADTAAKEVERAHKIAVDINIKHAPKGSLAAVEECIADLATAERELLKSGSPSGLRDRISRLKGNFRSMANALGECRQIANDVYAEARRKVQENLDAAKRGAQQAAGDARQTVSTALEKLRKTKDYQDWAKCVSSAKQMHPANVAAKSALSVVQTKKEPTTEADARQALRECTTAVAQSHATVKKTAQAVSDEMKKQWASCSTPKGACYETIKAAIYKQLEEEQKGSLNIGGKVTVEGVMAEITYAILFTVKHTPQTDIFPFSFTIQGVKAIGLNASGAAAKIGFKQNETYRFDLNGSRDLGELASMMARGMGDGALEYVFGPGARLVRGVSKPFGLERLLQLKSYRGGGKELCAAASASYTQDKAGSLELSQEACGSVENTVGSNKLPISFSVSPSLGADIDPLKNFLEGSGIGSLFGPPKLGGGASAKVTVELDCSKVVPKGATAGGIAATLANLPRNCPGGLSRAADVSVTLAIGWKAGKHDLTFSVTGTKAKVAAGALLEKAKQDPKAAARMAAENVKGSWKLTLQSTTAKEKSLGSSDVGSGSVGFTLGGAEKTICSGAIANARDLRNLLTPNGQCTPQSIRLAMNRK